MKYLKIMRLFPLTSFIPYIIFALLLSILGGCCGEIDNNKNLGRFFEILAKVESTGRTDAFNKKENAIGIYQIRAAYFKDAAEYDKSLIKYKHSDCYSPDVAKRVVIAYMNRYCKNGTMEQRARCHNSGPEWRKKYHLTDNYWARFKKNS